jgi:peptidoglycan/xylan/chitin deacetylase (PgdA/CDA1 family)
MDKVSEITAPVLMYHEVTDKCEQERVVRKTNPAYCMTWDSFHRQMGHLAAGGFRSLTLDELLDDGPGEKGVIITFDDGWDNNHSVAWPILAGAGLGATIFLISGFIGQPGYLSWEQVRELAEAGISIQSHTVSHRPLGLLADSEIRSELEDSKKTIENRIGRTVDHISMPQGVFNQRVIEMAAQAGYRSVSTSEPSLRHKAGNPAVISRINVSAKYDLATFGRIIAGDRSALLPTILNKKAKNLVKGLVGYDIYRTLYRLCYRIDDSGARTGHPEGIQDIETP